MRRGRTLFVSTLLVMVTAGAQQAVAQGSTFTLRSSDIQAGGTIAAKHILNGFGCTGQNVSPALSWSDAPDGTKSFALTMYDPDAPTGSGWWHWVLYDIPGNATQLRAGAGTDHSLAPAGSVEGMTDFGKPGYGGPCPPEGDRPHRYVFTLHALKVGKLDIPQGSTPALIGFNISANVLGKASFTATFGR
jgi:Raf kinase inhibitor-like YbhB/YbcL family protein